MLKKSKQQASKRVLFYTGISRAFRTTSIANLYEIAQIFPVVVLSEELDKETDSILRNKNFFPKVEEIISVNQFKDGKMGLLNENKFAFNMAKKIINEYRPEIVIFPTDTFLFDFYSMRFAKKHGAINIVLNSDLRFWQAEEMSTRTDLTNAYLKLPRFIPPTARLLAMRARKYIGYFLYNWVMPLLMFQIPFFGSSSRILYSIPGKKADYRITCFCEDYDLSLKEGILKEKLVFLKHPLERKEARKFMENVGLIGKIKQEKNSDKAILLLYPEENYGFRKKDNFFLGEKDLIRSRVEIVDLILKALDGWKVIIKPHPSTPNSKELKNIFEERSRLVFFTDPKETLERYIDSSDVIIGFSPVTSALFTASLQYPQKPVISLDFYKEILGDCYKSVKGIEYVESKKELKNILALIQSGKYVKKNIRNIQENGILKYENTIEVLNSLINKEKSDKV